MSTHSLWTRPLHVPGIAVVCALFYSLSAAADLPPPSAMPDQAEDEWSPEKKSTGAGQTAGTLMPVTITAGKRTQPQQSVNAAVVVVPARTLDDAQIVNTLDLASVLPGVQISQSGSMLFPLISLRGITSAQDFYNPALTIYVDGVPQLPVLSAQTLLNVDRVELLKGPQGTLYGKSAQGGVLNIVTKVPDNRLALQLRSGVSNHYGHVLQGQFSGALRPDLLYGTLALSQVSALGEMHNPVNGAADQGGTRAAAASARLRLAPAGTAWQANLTGARDCANGSQDAYLRFDDIHHHVIDIAAGVPLAYAQSYERRCGGSYALSATYDWSQWQLTAMSAWQTATIARAFPYASYFSEQPEQWRQNLQEIRLTSHADARAWDGVFGLYRQGVRQSRTASSTLVTPSILNVMTTHSDNHTQALAAYGDMTWHATAALDLEAGLRLAHDQAWTRFHGSALDADMNTTSFADTANNTDKRLLGKLAAGYTLNADWRAYANIAQGYKPAGFNLAPSSPADAQGFGTERSTSYEIGMRLSRQRLHGALALYQVNSKDVQLYSSNTVGYQSLHNVGDSRSRGLEFDLEWAATRRWTMALDGFINRAYFSRYLDPYGCNNCQGKRVPFAPHLGLNLRVQGALPVASTVVRPQLQVRWLGAQYFDTANSLRQGSYAVIDGTLHWLLQNGVELSLYVHNMGNRVYRSFAFSGGMLGNFAQTGMGRRIGMMLAYEY